MGQAGHQKNAYACSYSCRSVPICALCCAQFFLLRLDLAHVLCPLVAYLQVASRGPCRA